MKQVAKNRREVEGKEQETWRAVWGPVVNFKIDNRDAINSYFPLRVKSYQFSSGPSLSSFHLFYPSISQHPCR